MEDTTEKRLKQIAAKADVEFDAVVEKFEAEMEDFETKGRQVSSVSQEQLEGHAVNVVRSDVLNIGSGGFGGGEVEELPVLALGYDHRDGEYFVTDGDGMVALGIVNPPEDPAGVAIFVLDSEHGVDLDNAAYCFEPLARSKVYTTRRMVGDWDSEPKLRKGGSPVYICNSTGDSKLERPDPDDIGDDDVLAELPADREAMRDLIHENFITDDDFVTLQNYAEHVSKKNANGYSVAFGADVKRFRGQIVDVYDNGDGFGTMTLMDDTVADENEVAENLVTDRMRTPGLQVLMDPDLLNFGENSLVDVYGHIEQTDDGQYRMRGLGIVPIIEYERERYDNDDSSDDDAVEEETI